MRLIWTSNSARGRHDIHAFGDQPCQRDLVVMLDLAELLLEGAVAGMALQARELRRVVEHGFAAGLAQQVGELRIGQHQPAAER